MEVKALQQMMSQLWQMQENLEHKQTARYAWKKRAPAAAWSPSK